MPRQQAFAGLRALRAFERRHLAFVVTFEDRDLILEIGCRQEQGRPVTQNELHDSGIGAPATIERRLLRLKALGVVHQRVQSSDARKRELWLDARIMRLYRRYWREHAQEWHARA
jgi:hypothetical protein